MQFASITEGVAMLNKIKLAVGCGAFALAMSMCVSAGKLSLAETPLVVARAVDPNIMILLDTSGSMQKLIIESPYDPTGRYSQQCKKADNVLPDTFVYGGETIPAWYYLDVDNTGKARIATYASTVHDWGTSSTDDRCFDGSTEYFVDLVRGDTTVWPPSYSGNYLNWYFSNANQSGPANFGIGANRRPGVKMRLEVGKSAMASMVGAVGEQERLTDVRVGLAGFDSTNKKADFVMKLTDIDDDADRTALLSAINNFNASGETPLASSLASLGRYFVDGHLSEVLSSDSSGADVTAGALFDNQPTYNGSAPVAGEVMPHSCQRNSIVALTDGEPVGDDNYSDVLAKWGDTTVNHSDAATGDFDDIAQALYELDLRPETYPNDKNNVTTHTIAFALDMPMLERASTELGGTHHNAADASELTSALKAIAATVKTQSSTVASVAFNSGRVVTGSSIFQAKFNTDGYSGQLLSFALSGDGSIGSNATWDAGKRLAAMTPSNRKMFTYNGNDGVEFAWANLSDAQKEDLGYAAIPNDPNDADEVTAFNAQGQKVLDFIRGDNTHDDLRSRNANPNLDYTADKFLLGDIVNSTPVFVGPPELNWPDHAVDDRFGLSTANYSAYKTSAGGRTPVVYVGANDGMLHGFNASTGDEVFAYIPGAVYSSASGSSGLHYLAAPNYNHRFYVDLTPAVSDVFIPAADGGTSAWRTVLVGGLRAGGRGLFALDVSDPTDFADPAINAGDVVLWEFSSADDADLGYTYSQPTIALMPNDRWAAIVGNGYNSDAENAYLFIIFLDGGLDGVWTDGSNDANGEPTDVDYIKIAAGGATSNGLSKPRVVDLGGDGVVDRAYAGDLQGNMWAFDLSSTVSSNWGVAHSGGVPLFTAPTSVDSVATTQAITAAPILVKNREVPDDVTNAPNVLVLFGTGKFLEPTDASANIEPQSYYGVWDAGDGSRSRSHLVQREIITETRSVSDPNAVGQIDIQLRKVQPAIANQTITWGANDYGWYMDLEDKAAVGGAVTREGERVVTDSLLRREVLLFNTIIPDNAECSSGGTGWLMSLDYLTGLAPSFAVFDADKDGTIGGQGDIGYVGEKYTEGLPSQSGVLGDHQYTPGSDGDIETREIYVGKGSKEGRLSWEELLRN